MARVRGTDYTSGVDILFNLDPFTARPIMIDEDGVTANAEGKKIVKAGTPVDVDGKIVATADNATAKYLVLTDVDVTHGPREGSGLYRGTVNADKMLSYAGITVDAALKGALDGIKFMSDNDTDY